jgi:hypothetical protein
MAAKRRLTHDHEAGAIEMPDKPRRNDLRHRLIGVVDALAAI